MNKRFIWVSYYVREISFAILFILQKYKNVQALYIMEIQNYVLFFIAFYLPMGSMDVKAMPWEFALSLYLNYNNVRCMSYSVIKEYTEWRGIIWVGVENRLEAIRVALENKCNDRIW